MNLYRANILCSTSLPYNDTSVDENIYEYIQLFNNTFRQF